jgi:phosphatidylglycerophosphate synthase/putative flippase GtrA
VTDPSSAPTSLLGGLIRPEDAPLWMALAPGLVLATYFIGALVVFTAITLVRGLPRDAEVGPRGRTVIIGYYLRHYFFWAVRPLWALVLASGVPATGITILSALIGMASGFAAAAGHFTSAGWIFLLSGILDTLDGRVARTRGEVTRSGSAIDSIMDRYTDSAVLIGLAWYYREGWELLAVLLALFGGSMVPYVRAKGESLGVPIRGGQLQRAERMLVLGGALAVSPIVEALLRHGSPHPAHGVVVAALVFLAVGSNVTALSRLVELLRALDGPRPPPRRRWTTQVALTVIAAALATGFDYGIVLELVEKLHMAPAAATALGAAAGGFLNFHLNRVITFRAGGAQLPQAARYTVVSGMSALLNAGGVAVLTMNPLPDYRVAWWIARAAVFLFWNFPLQRMYVFPVEDPAAEPAAQPGPDGEGKGPGPEAPARGAAK